VTVFDEKNFVFGICSMHLILNFVILLGIVVTVLIPQFSIYVNSVQNGWFS